MQRADKRKFHYIYKITRIDGSGKYYIGMHSTDDMDDGYFGSGKLISRSIKKYGLELHEKQIIEQVSSRDQLKLREKQIVNTELLGDILCMNLRPGGDGWDSEEAKIVGMKGNTSANRNAKEIAQRAMKTKRLRGFTAFGGSNNWLGKKHTEEAKEKIGLANSLSQLGERNSQYGTCWIKKDGLCKKIKKENLNEYLQDGYSLGRITRS